MTTRFEGERERKRVAKACPTGRCKIRGHDEPREERSDEGGTRKGRTDAGSGADDEDGVPLVEVVGLGGHAEGVVESER
jgi:hypothetical protein